MEKIFEYDFTSNGKYHVELYNNRIEITVEGTFNLLVKKWINGTIIIPINKISAIEYTVDGDILEFVVSGMDHNNSYKDKIRSDNAIFVDSKEDILMLKVLKELICDLL